MKIECDKCGAKYSIADDKVRGKTFKIRCKKCSNVIIVRDKAGGDATESEAPADEPGWHLAIGGETVGPLAEAEVRDRYAAGEIDKETSVWQEGFEDWLPLGDVQTFSDLPDRAAAAAPLAAAPDPFAGGGDDDYSSRPAATHEPEPAPMRASPAVLASPVASTPAKASAPAGGGGGDSPRVNALTGARNENSVLFSLDSLSSVAMGSGKPSGGGGGGGGGGGLSSFSSPSASSHTPSATGNSEGSGLIDIRSMGAMLGGGGGGGGGGGDDDRDDSMLPSFGGTGFGGLSAAPLMTAQPTTSAPEPILAEPQRPSQAPLYIIIGILVLGMAGLGIFVATREPPPPTQPQIVYQSAPVQPDKDDKDKDEDEDKKKKAKDEEGEEAGDAAEAGDAKTEDPKTKTVTKKGGKTTPAKPGDKKDTKTDAPANSGGADSGKTETKKAPAEDNTPSVECILDPSKCKKGGGGGGGGGGGSKPPDPSLPEKLELDDIKAGTASTKAAAESKCKGQAKGGEKVKIKLSISGATGSVLSASPVEDGGNPGLASCVAAELKKSTFKKVQKEQTGTQISVSF